MTENAIVAEDPTARDPALVLLSPPPPPTSSSSCSTSPSSSSLRSHRFRLLPRPVPSIIRLAPNTLSTPQDADRPPWPMPNRILDSPSSPHLLSRRQTCSRQSRPQHAFLSPRPPPSTPPSTHPSLAPAPISMTDRSTRRVLQRFLPQHSPFCSPRSSSIPRSASAASPISSAGTLRLVIALHC